jgi:UPF0271 protein
MPDTCVVPVVDLNADLAEGDVLSPSDVGVLASVTSASLACGFHAGNRAVMRATAAACVERGTVIGAHVSYRDRAGFGRRELDVDPDQLVEDITEQCSTLGEVVVAAGGRVAFVKPHGALYNRMGTDAEVARAVVAAVGAAAGAARAERSGLGGQPGGVLVAQWGSAVVAPAMEAGLRVVFEGFPDRGYQPDGRLADRSDPRGLVSDPEASGRRAVSLVLRHGVEAVDGTWARIKAGTLCIHGDAPDAPSRARAVRAALEGAGITVAPFLRPGEGPALPG